MYLLGYILKQCRLYLVDKSLNLVSYALEESVLAYQTAILRGDTEGASKVLPRIPKEHRNRIAQFLEAQGMWRRSRRSRTNLSANQRTRVCRLQGTSHGGCRGSRPQV